MDREEHSAKHRMKYSFAIRRERPTRITQEKFQKPSGTAQNFFVFFIIKSSSFSRSFQFRPHPGCLRVFHQSAPDSSVFLFIKVLSPEAYDEAYEDFYESLDKLDKRLETNRFLFGDYITDSDVRAYVTLIRWDVSYFHNVGPVKKPIRDYKNIWGYLKELYASSYASGDWQNAMR